MIGQKQIKGVCLSLLQGGSKGFNYCLNTKNNGFLFFHVAGGLLDAESLLRRLVQKPVVNRQHLNALFRNL